MIRFALRSAKNRFCAIAVLFLTICSAAAATNLTGTFKNPDGSLVNGKIIFLLSQPARLSDQSAQIVPMVKIFSVTNGALESGAFVYGNDVLVPGGTYYLVRLVDENNNLLFEQKWSISGTNLNLGTLTPTTTGVVFPDPLIKNSSSGQAVQGPVTFSAPLTAFSLTLSGNLNPGAADVYDLGNSSAPWRELHALRWNSLFAPGTASGICSPPSDAPATSFSTTGGTLADGTYYAKVTYVNRNGETTASPAATITITGGSGSAAIKAVSQNDTNWRTGCYGVRVYLSNDNVNFYLQSPVVAVNDFMVDSTKHLIGLGSGVQKMFPSPTFSGTTPPVTNTAVIDPLQVAVNATIRPTFSDYFGCVIAPAVLTGSYAHVLTTPLVLLSGSCLRGMGGSNTTVGNQTRIYASWANSKLAAVMIFGGGAIVDDVGVLTPGNAMMVLGGAGIQAGNVHTLVRNVSLYTQDTTHTYSALVNVGIIYENHFNNVFMRGDAALIEFRNFSGGIHYYEDARWDAGGPSFIKNVPGWTDPDSGSHNAAFPFGATRIKVANIRTEGGTGILWDCVGLGIELDNVEQADTSIAGGTDSIAKFGTHATYGGNSGPVVLSNTYFGGGSTNRVGMNWVGSAGRLFMYGNSGPGVGSSTGISQTIDFNNLALEVYSFASASGSFDPNAAVSTPHAINVPTTARIYAFGIADSLGGGANVVAWNEIVGRQYFSYKSGGTLDRNNGFSLLNNGGTTFELRSKTDAAMWGANQSGDFSVTRFLSVGTNAPTGASVSTPGIGLANGKAIWLRNAANSANLFGLFLNGSNQLEVGTDSGIAGIVLGNGSSVITKVLSATATLDFPNTSLSTCSDLTMTVTGAADGDSVFVGAPNGSVPAGGNFSAWVSSANTVKVRFCADGTARDPASGSFRVTVVKF